MTRVLVTGANGHIGCNLVRDLLAHDYEVVAMVRETSDTTGLGPLPITTTKGDVRDAAAVGRAMDGCELVFHLGSPYAVWAKDPREIVEPAVRGVENVLRAAKERGVRRVVVTSSSNAVGFSRDPQKPLDETHWNDRTKSPYIRAKNEQERRTWKLADELALDVVTVLPTAVLGRLDYRRTPTTGPFVDVITGKGPVPFAMNLADVRDVARTHVLAAERGRAGERYLAGGFDADPETLATIIEKITGRRPKVGLPPLWVLRVVATLTAPIAALTGKPPPITHALLDDAAGGHGVFDCSKARRELGLTPHEPAVVVHEVVRWALFMGWLPDAMMTRLSGGFAPDPDWPRPR